MFAAAADGCKCLLARSTVCTRAQDDKPNADVIEFAFQHFLEPLFESLLFSGGQLDALASDTTDAEDRLVPSCSQSTLPDETLKFAVRATTTVVRQPLYFDGH